MLKYGEGRSKAGNIPLRRDIARRIADAVDDAEPAVRTDLHEAVDLTHEPLALHDLPRRMSQRRSMTRRWQIDEHQAKLDEIGDEDRLSATYTSMPRRSHGVSRRRSATKSRWRAFRWRPCRPPQGHRLRQRAHSYY